MHQFQKLTVWQKAMDMTIKLYDLTSSFPDEENFGLTSQMRRAGVSVPSNIAEGAGRNSDQQFKYHLSVAAGSTSELYTQVLLAKAFKYLNETEADSMSSELSHIINMLHKLQESIK